MRIMAGRAHPVLYGRMHVFHGAELIMALVTQRRDLLGQLEGLCFFLRVRRSNRLMAGITGVCRRVDIFGFQEALVAFCGYATVFRGCGLFRRGGLFRGRGLFRRRGRRDGPVCKEKAQGKKY